MEENNFLEDEEELWRIISANCEVFEGEEYDYLYFNTKEMKKIYKKDTFREFDKVFGENGFQFLLSFREGVEYSEENDTWYIEPEFFH